MKKKIALSILCIWAYQCLFAQVNAAGLGVSGQSAFVSYTLGSEVYASTKIFKRGELHFSYLLGGNYYSLRDKLQTFSILIQKPSIICYYTIIDQNLKWKLGLGTSVISETTKYAELVDYNTNPVTVKMALHKYRAPTVSFRTRVEKKFKRKNKYGIALLAGTDGFSLKNNPLDDLQSFVIEGNSTIGISIPVSSWVEKTYWNWHVQVCVFKQL